MQYPQINKISWLVRKRNNKIKSLGFLRIKNNGFYIVGGETGSHSSGHGEGWKTKWAEYIKEGYFSMEEAVSQNIIPKRWKPPLLSLEDKEIIHILSSAENF